MHEERAARQLFAQVFLYMLGEVVAFLDAPTSRHENVHRDEPALSGGSGADGVKPDVLPFIEEENLRDSCLIPSGQSAIQERSWSKQFTSSMPESSIGS